MSSYSWGSAPVISFSVTDNIQRTANNGYAGYVTVTLGGVGGNAYFGYSISASVDGTKKQLKGNSPSTWSAGQYSASFYVEGVSAGTSVSISVTLSSNSGRSDADVSYTAYIGGGGSSGEDTDDATPISWDASKGNSARLGGKLTIKLNPQRTYYTHKLTYTIGTTTGTIAEKVGYVSSYEWTVPTSLIRLVNKSYGTLCTITCTTYSSSREVGKREQDAVLYPPADAGPVVPASVRSFWPQNDGVVAGFPGYVKGYTKLLVRIFPDVIEMKYSATLKSITVTFGGKTVAAEKATDLYNGREYYKAVTAVLQDLVGRLTVTVTDSYGFSSGVTINIRDYKDSFPGKAIYDYAPPSLSGIAIYRSDDAMVAADAGAHITTGATVRWTSLNGWNDDANHCSLTAQYKEAGAQTFSAAVKLTSGQKTRINGSAVIDPEKSYTVRITAKDRIGRTAIYEATVPTATITFHLKDGGKGAAFGKISEKDNTFECGWDAEFSRDVRITGKLTVGSGNLRNGDNLLDNWYWNPNVMINTRGVASGADWNGGYGIDRWKGSAGMKVYFATADGYLYLDSSTGTTSGYLQQLFEPALAKALVGKTVTASVLCTALPYRGVHSGTFTFPEIGSKTTIPTDFGTIEVGSGAESGVGFFLLRVAAGGTLRPMAAKLELGDTQTLAHQENTVWTLNEIPRREEQERICQRYCFAPFIGGSIFTRTTFVGTGIVQFFVSTPVTLRTNPVLESGTVNVGAWGSTGLAHGFTYTYSALRNSLRILASKAGHGLSDMWMELNKVIFSADL